METEPVVELTGLTKTYGDHVAVDDLSLTVRRGEIFGILGTNGAGKTTSVECAQGIRRPDSGTVRVLGHDPFSDRSALRSRVGSQLQDSSLPDRLRVGEAVQLFAESRQHGELAMDEWQLTEIAKTPFDGLSGGQRQRLFLALALMNRPEVVFLDELTQGLDPDARRAVWRLIEQVRDRGATVVLVTHFMEEAEVLCDRVAVMNGGRVVARGTPDELIEEHSAGVSIRVPAATSTGSLSEMAVWFDGLPGVTDVRVRGDEVVVAGSSAAIAHVGAALVERDAVPPRLRVEHPSLEAALLNLVTEQPTLIGASS